MQRFLILTASFGEGHNTASKSIQSALQNHPHAEVETRVADLYRETNPLLNKALCDAYRFAITQWTSGWEIIFKILEKRGVLESTLWTLDRMQTELLRIVHDFQPDVIVSTYPVYIFLMDRLRQKHPDLTLPFITVVTDSTAINSAWYRCRSDQFIVPDQPTADLLIADGVNKDTIHVLGFPVAPIFESLSPTHPGPPWKALFLPASGTTQAVEAVQHLAELEHLQLTVLTGKSNTLRSALEETEGQFPERIKLLGWTDKMPELLASHHIFIGKAGGAITQEAIAAKCPFIVSHVVPGQEEGNISLIEKSGIGILAGPDPGRLRDIITGTFAHEGNLWSTWRSNLARISKASASRQIAEHLLAMARDR